MMLALQCSLVAALTMLPLWMIVLGVLLLRLRVDGELVAT